MICSYLLKNESYEFFSELDLGGGRLNCEFKSKYYNIKTNISPSRMFVTLRESINWMRYNKHCIDKLQELFSDYEDINFIELFFDLTKNIQDELMSLRIYQDNEKEIYHRVYRDVLERYGINCNGIDLNELNHFNSTSPIVNRRYNLKELLA